VIGVFYLIFGIIRVPDGNFRVREFLSYFFLSMATLAKKKMKG
jgi:hypothetical protein